MGGLERRGLERRGLETRGLETRGLGSPPGRPELCRQRKKSAGRRRYVWALLLFFAFSGTACKRHVVLRVQAVSLARVQAVEWQCEAGRPSCEGGGVIDESAWNQSGTAYLPLPECAGGVSEVFLEGTGRSTRAVVMCQGEGRLTERSVARSALLLRTPMASDPTGSRTGGQLCLPGAAVCRAAPPPLVSPKRTFPLPDCGTGGIGRILVNEPFHHPSLRVVCLDPDAARVDEDCPDGAAPEPDLANGGFVCPGTVSHEPATLEEAP
jgi:hypothetical protein